MSSTSIPSNLLDTLTGTQRGSFCTISTANKTFGEVDPFFVAKFFEQLENHWEIYDGKGKKHNVEFNGSAIQPLFTTGWDTLRNYYSLTGDKHFFFFTTAEQNSSC
ncbi:DNA helicase [Trifolium repens]|nr:DNA helicase [Trifolium repens]